MQLRGATRQNRHGYRPLSHLGAGRFALIMGSHSMSAGRQRKGSISSPWRKMHARVLRKEHRYLPEKSSVGPYLTTCASILAARWRCTQLRLSSLVVQSSSWFLENCRKNPMASFGSMAHRMVARRSGDEVLINATNRTSADLKVRSYVRIEARKA